MAAPDYPGLLALGRLRRELDRAEHAIGEAQESIDHAIEAGGNADQAAGVDVAGSDAYWDRFWLDVNEMETLRWPAEPLEFSAPIAALSGGVSVIDELTAGYCRLVDLPAGELRPGVPDPSLEAIGVLSALLAHAELELGALKGHVERLRQLHGHASTLCSLAAV